LLPGYGCDRATRKGAGSDIKYIFGVVDGLRIKQFELVNEPIHWGYYIDGPPNNVWGRTEMDGGHRPCSIGENLLAHGEIL